MRGRSLLLFFRIPEEHGEDSSHHKGDDEAGHDHGAVVQGVVAAHEHAEAEEGDFNYGGSTIYVIRLENAKQNFDINKLDISYSENFYSLKRHQRFYNSKLYKIVYQDQSFRDYVHYTGIRVSYDDINRANP